MMSIRQALAMDLRLNSGRFATTLLLCLLSLVVAVLGSDALMAVLPIWAALAWYRYGRGDTIEREELRAGLGLARADRVRGRVALIAVESALLILTTSLWLLLAPTLDLGVSIRPGPTFTVSGPPGLSEVVLVLVGAVQSVLVLLLTAIVVGGECVTRRPGAAAAVVTCLVYLGAGLLSAGLALPLGMTGLSGDPLLPYLLIGAASAVVSGVLVLVLRRRVRTWIGLLDSGAAARGAVAV